LTQGAGNAIADSHFFRQVAHIDLLDRFQKLRDIFRRSKQHRQDAAFVFLGAQR